MVYSLLRPVTGSMASQGGVVVSASVGEGVGLDGGWLSVSLYLAHSVSQSKVDIRKGGHTECWAVRCLFGDNHYRSRLR